MEAIVFTDSADKLIIDAITSQFFSVFDNTLQQPIDWTILQNICIPEIIIIKKTGLAQTVYDLRSFIEPRKIILTNGTLTDFNEWETAEETRIINHIAQRYSAYRKKGCLHGAHFTESGTKLIHFIKTTDGWKISALVWEDELT